MTFTRKDYRAVAQVIRSQWEAEVEASKLRGDSMDGVFAVESLTFRIADMFALDNPAFKRDLFLRAALGEPSMVVS